MSSIQCCISDIVIFNCSNFCSITSFFNKICSIVLSTFVTNLLYSVFLTKLLTSSILFSTTVKADFVAKLLTSGILLTADFLIKPLTSGIFCLSY